jgi:Zn-finger nucleic acid-binding protein
MQLMRVRNIELDACPKCRGIWFDSSELDKIMGGAKSFEEQAYLGEPLGAKIDCPSCGNQMQYMNIESTTIDYCKSCEGVWLDAGELTELAQYLPERQMTDATAPYQIEEKDSQNFLDKVKTIFSKRKE